MVSTAKTTNKSAEKHGYQTRTRAWPCFRRLVGTETYALPFLYHHTVFVALVPGKRREFWVFRFYGVIDSVYR